MERLDFTQVLWGLRFPMSLAFDNLEKKIYFTQFYEELGGGFISRCNLDGSDVEVVVTSPDSDNGTLRKAKYFISSSFFAKTV